MTTQREQDKPPSPSKDEAAATTTVYDDPINVPEAAAQPDPDAADPMARQAAEPADADAVLDETVVDAEASRPDPAPAEAVEETAKLEPEATPPPDAAGEETPEVAPVDAAKESSAVAPDSMLHATIETLVATNRRQAAQINDVTRTLERMEQTLRTFDKALERKDEINHRLHNELKDHKAGQSVKMIQPFLKLLIRLERNMQKTVRAWEEQGNHGPKDIGTLRGLIEELQVAMQQTAELEQMPVTPDEQRILFDGKIHTSNQTIPTDDPERDNCIARSVFVGYTFNDRPIEKEKVDVYKLTKQ